MASLVLVVESSTEQGWKNDHVEIEHSRRERHDFKFKGGFLSGNVGQAVVQNGGSADHGINGSQVSYFSINKCFQVGKWVANHLLNSTTLKLPTSRETSYT